MPTRDQLVQAWGDHIIGRLRPKAKALFQAGRFVAVEDDKAVFGLPNEIHRNRCEEVRGEIEAALADHFDRPVGLVLVVDAGADDGPRPESGSTGPGSSSPVPPSTAAVSPPGLSGGIDPATAQAVRGGRGDETEDLSAFDMSELGEVADFDNSAESRVMKAFPGAEEVG